MAEDRLSQVEAALVKADAAGNTEDARALANEVRRLRGEQTSIPKPLEAAVAPWEAAANLTSGMAGGAVAGLTGLAQGAKNLVSPGMPAGDRVRQVHEALTYQPRTQAGEKAAGMIAYPFEKLAEAGRYAGEKTQDATGSPLAATGVDTMIQSSPMLLGFLRPAAKKAVDSRQAVLDQQKAVNAPRDQAIELARENGITIDPASANPSILNRWMQGFAGSAKTQLLASTKNIPVVNDIVRRNFGIDQATPLSPEALGQVRKIAAAEGYEPIRSLGDIKLDADYFKALDTVEATPAGASKSFNVKPSPLQEAVQIAREPKTPGSFDASSAVDLIKLFREQADSAFAKGEPALAKGYKQITKALEDQIDRHLNTPSQYANPVAADLITKYRVARQKIAQTYDVQDALNGNNVDARVLAKKLKKGTPLSGNLKDLAEIATRFGGSMRATEKAGGINNPYVQGGWGDLGLGGLSGMGHLLSHGGGVAPSVTIAALGLAARPAIRAGIASKPYQNAMANAPSYSPSFPYSLADFLTSEGVGPAATGLTADRKR